MNPRVQDVKYLKSYKLVLRFTNGELRLFDMADYLNYPVYKKLKDPAICSNVKAAFGTVVWENDIDFDPDTLYLESKPFSGKIS